MVCVYFGIPLKPAVDPRRRADAGSLTSAWAWPRCMALWINGEVGLVKLQHNCRHQIPLAAPLPILVQKAGQSACYFFGIRIAWIAVRPAEPELVGTESNCPTHDNCGTQFGIRQQSGAVSTKSTLFTTPPPFLWKGKSSGAVKLSVSRGQHWV